MIYREEHSSSETYYDNFLSISRKLTGKYGDFEDETKWKSDLFKDDPKKYGFAASYGDVVFKHRWTTDRSDITLILMGDNFKSNLGLVYIDKTYTKIEQTGF